MKRSTVLAALVLAVLGAYIYWFEREPVSDSEGEKIFDVEEDAVRRIEIRRKDEDPVVLEKAAEADENDWRLVSPVAADADAGEVDLLTQNLASMRFERVVAKASEVQLASFGLDSPRIEVRFHTKDGSERSLAFGGDAPTPSNQYGRRDGGEDIFVLGSHLSLNFDKSAWDLRDKGLFDVEASVEPKRIEITRESGNVMLERQAGLWFVAEPRSRADRYRASSLANRFRDAEMKEIVSEGTESLEPYGLESPSRRIRIDFEGEGNPPIEVTIGASKDSDFYARTPSRKEVFVLDSDLVTELDKPLRELQSMKLFDYSTSDVRRFEIETAGAAERVFERVESGEEKKWRQTKPEPSRDLDTTAVEDFLYALNGASAEEILADPQLGEPDFTITVWSGEPEVEETLLVVKSVDTLRVRRAGEEVTLQLSEEVWSDIETKMKLEPKG